MKYIVIFIIGELIGAFMYNTWFLPVEIEDRAKDLNIMHYDSKLDKFVPNDTIVLNSSELKYLINKTTNIDN